MKPLTSATDSLKLNELEERFPGAKMILTTKDRQYEITYKDNSLYGNIYCEDSHTTGAFFTNFGIKPRLSAEWRGRQLDLSHLV